MLLSSEEASLEAETLYSLTVATQAAAMRLYARLEMTPGEIREVGEYVIEARDFSLFIRRGEKIAAA